MLKADPKRDLCMQCHKDAFSKSKFVHGPVAVGACIVCHKPPRPSPNCTDSRHPIVVLTCPGTPRLETGIHLRAASGCTHAMILASEHKFQLREEAAGLCLSCHKDRFDQITADAVVVHGAITAAGGCTGATSRTHPACHRCSRLRSRRSA